MTRKQFVVTIIVAHFAVATLHGAAHEVLAVPAGGWAGLLVIAAAVYAGPLAALVALLRGWQRAGALVLSVSMAVALVYGFMLHYVLHTPDKAAYASPGLWGLVFRASAVAIAVLEAGGLAAGVRLMLSRFPDRAPAEG